MTSDRPSEAATAGVAAEALGLWGRPSNELRLVRHGTNAVFDAGTTVVRVSEPDVPADEIQVQVDLCGWLHESGFPTPEPLGILTLGDVQVSLWEKVEAVREPTLADLGELARELHTLTDSYDGDLPQWEPLGRMGRRLARLTPDDTLSAEDCAILATRRDELVEAAGEIAFVLPEGPIHGDLHTGNVIVARTGPRLIDFDRIARGPREWDLIDPYAGCWLFARGEAEWRGFVDNYHYDVATFADSDVLVQLRALFMFTWLIGLRRNATVEAEIRRRMQFFRDPGADWPHWTAV